LNAAAKVLEREGLMNEEWESAYGYFGRMLGFRKD
jgi:hypothetical protein